MRKLIILLIFFTASLMAQTREPAVAGRWYPANPQKLNDMLASFFQNVELEKSELDPFGIISPHAGFVYSGQVAAYGYSLLKDRHYDVVFLLGSSHHYHLDKISIYSGNYYKLPTGKIEIAQKITQTLIQSDERFTFAESIHTPEHSLEAQLPFLQYHLKNFKIVPIITSTQDLGLLKKLAEDICKIVETDHDKKFLFVCSSDMSHYHSDKLASKIDDLTIELILDRKWDKLRRNINNGKCELCGYHALFSFLKIMEHFGHDKGKLLKYAHSGDVSGDNSRVVGYCSIVFPKRKEQSMKDEEKMYLLKLARDAITDYLHSGRETTPDKPEYPNLLKERAVFVTLHKHGQLRGCIGHMHARMPVYKAVAEMAVSAAFQDPRFPKLHRNELSEIVIEISVLSPMQPVDDYKKIRMGTDGVWVKKGFQSGVYLPQVAQETGWSREEFLESLCAQKAGLPQDAYKDPATELYVFQVEKFSE